MILPSTIPQPHPEIVARILEDEAVLVLPIRGEVKVLNDLGARIWTLIDGSHNIEEIVHIIYQEYETSLETITEDTFEFLEQLANRGMIVIS